MDGLNRDRLRHRGVAVAAQSGGESASTPISSPSVSPWLSSPRAGASGVPERDFGSGVASSRGRTPSSTRARRSGGEPVKVRAWLQVSLSAKTQRRRWNGWVLGDAKRFEAPRRIVGSPPAGRDFQHYGETCASKWLAPGRRRSGTDLAHSSMILNETRRFPCTS